ncbi:unnamed protein product [Miscanthus lutarioriparius]|uniref:UDP-glucose 4-epimerase n=1 Tax=Miscanthus lutarioriparius TaxID=422564 RepID=A0A811RRZ9_9POAL|nr:unnamed protein product [Miscanthus lutarioriparius]
MVSAVLRTILVTGGAGYIGSHTVLQLLQQGFRVVVVDNLDNASEVALVRVAELAGHNGANNLVFHKVDLRDRHALEDIFSSHRFEAVVHFAGLKAVGESVHKPLLYYDNNLSSAPSPFLRIPYRCPSLLLDQLVFSSSATVYGWPKEVPCTEEFPLCTTNPYGRTKLMIEDICRDVQRSDPDWKIILLSKSHLTVYGTDYNTKDGTGVRDYIHVVDLADGHIAALRKLYEDSDKIGCEVYNLGTGKGTSVLEMVAAFEKVSGKKIPLMLAGRRPGDAEIVYAATAKAEKELKWKAKYGVEEMCRDLWNWASKNPYGYAGSPDKSN